MATDKSKKEVFDKGKVRAVAVAMVHLPAEVDPPIRGSRTRIWKQDPSVKGLDLPREVYVHAQVNEGPSDSQIVIRGLSPVTPDLNRDFLIDPASDEKAFDAVHTYTIIRQVLTMYHSEFRAKNFSGNGMGNRWINFGTKRRTSYFSSCVASRFALWTFSASPD